MRSGHDRSTSPKKEFFSTHLDAKGEIDVHKGESVPLSRAEFSQIFPNFKKLTSLELTMPAEHWTCTYNPLSVALFFVIAFDRDKSADIAGVLRCANALNRFAIACCARSFEHASRHPGAARIIKGNCISWRRSA
jgi:hypothetical protein